MKKQQDWLTQNPHMMGFRILDDPQHRKSGRSMWHKEGEGWSISIPIPAWQSSLMRFTAWNIIHGVDYPVNIRFSIAGQPGRTKIYDHHELEAAVRVLQEPLLLMAGGTPLARRLQAGIR